MGNQITARIVNGFVTPEQDGIAAHGGNPAAVVVDADGLSDEQMLDIAAKVGLSETAFVSKSDTEGFRLDFFTPNRRIAHCGHATIATFSFLAETGRLTDGETSKETVDGPRKIIVREGAAFMEQLAPKYERPEAWADRGVTGQDVLNSLGISSSDISDGGAPILVNTGNSFIVVGVKSGDVLAQIKPDQTAINQISEQLDLIGYYVFTTDAAATSANATTRMFAPRYAIEEESATGMAAGPLACLLHDVLGVEETRIVIEQGQYMAPPSPSIIDVQLQVQGSKITGLMAGGYGKVMREIVVDYSS